MKSYLLPLLAGLVLLLPACKNDDETPGTCSVPLPSALDYIPLQIGNYWIYDWFRFESPGTSGVFNFTDTLTVIGMETIEGKDYFHLRRTDNQLITDKDIFLRDSLGFMVNENGYIDFTAENLGTVFQSDSIGSWLIVEDFVEEDLVEVEVPAGTFFSLHQKKQLTFLESGIPTETQSFENFIVSGLGKIKGTTGFVSSDVFFEYRLIEYNLQ